MEFLKWTAAIILIIMAYTWSSISISLHHMIAVSDEFIYVAGVLISIVSGQGAKEALLKWKKN